MSLPNGPVEAQFYNVDPVSSDPPSPQIADPANPSQVVVVVTSTVTTYVCSSMSLF